MTPTYSFIYFLKGILSFKGTKAPEKWQEEGSFVKLVFIEDTAGGLISDLSSFLRVCRQYSILQEVDEGIHPMRFVIYL